MCQLQYHHPIACGRNNDCPATLHPEPSLIRCPLAELMRPGSLKSRCWELDRPCSAARRGPNLTEASEEAKERARDRCKVCCHQFRTIDSYEEGEGGGGGYGSDGGSGPRSGFKRELGLTMTMGRKKKKGLEKVVKSLRRSGSKGGSCEEGQGKRGEREREIGLGGEEEGRLEEGRGGRGKDWNLEGGRRASFDEGLERFMDGNVGRW
ncbi:hypothetical protein QBC42DRAFT_250385 [Cladorrhinum samala]|uniref:Uncharacterized protein n=1 Tax=Cladorrhinum samala TaxID=585594 RepID=A0AAV9HU86_9PEZI|nr:hypothetical protein QBC42DRAFT_250385 [Cladorrhinum samala]